MKVNFEYDRDGLEVTLPEHNLLAVVEKELPDPEGESAWKVAEALARPWDTPPLADLARGARTACVLIPDITRPVPLRLILPPLLEALEAGGLQRENILLLIATGLHRPNEGAELEEMIGAEIAARYRVENHAALDGPAHVNLGMTRNGTRALVDRRLVEADLRVTVGLVEPHFMAGFSGGRKLVCPGVCAEETIHAFHGYEILNSPTATNCRLEGNPVHAMSTEIAWMAGIHFSVNVVIDARRRLRAVAAGALEPAFHAACTAAADLTVVEVSGKADVVVVSGGGYPLDTTWYQAIKGLVAAEAVVKPGGVIIQAAGLRDGVGSADFARLFTEMESLADFRRAIATPGYYRSEQWELQLYARVAEKARIMLYSHNVPPDTAAGWFVEPVPSVEAGVERALTDLGPEVTLIAMPHGPYVIPLPASQ